VWNGFSKRSRSSTKVLVNGVVVWSARHFLYGCCHSLDGATSFSKVHLNKLYHSVHNEVPLNCAKFGADLITISKDTGHKTKWPRFWPTR